MGINIIGDVALVMLLLSPFYAIYRLIKYVTHELSPATQERRERIRITDEEKRERDEYIENLIQESNERRIKWEKEKKESEDFIREYRKRMKENGMK